MSLPNTLDQIIDSLKQKLITCKTGNQRLRVKSLMKKFNLQRRTEENTTKITELLRENGIIINPSIMKLGDDWELGFEDWIYLSMANDGDEIDDDIQVEKGRYSTFLKKVGNTFSATLFGKKSE